MIVLYGLAMVVSVGIYAIARPLSRTIRIVLAVGSFLLLSALIAIWVGTLRDEPLDGTRTVTPEEVANPSPTTAPSSSGHDD